MKILNFGSINLDYVYRVPHIVRPGETIPSKSFKVFAGGKGANQSVALAKAGATVIHAGKVGSQDRWLVDRLAKMGVDTRFIEMTKDSTGHAIIQVDDNGENAIFLFQGANMQIERRHIDSVFSAMEEDALLLLQNEISEIPYIISTAREKNMKVCLNPAPFDDSVCRYPLDLVNILVFNETEGQGLTGKEPEEEIITELARRFPQCTIILTLGAEGAVYHCAGEHIRVPAPKVQAVDTTAAGDTFIGYFLALYAEGMDPRFCLENACRAASICVTRHGASDSIPERHTVMAKK